MQESRKKMEKEKKKKDVSMKLCFKERYISWEYGYHLLWLTTLQRGASPKVMYLLRQPTSSDYRIHGPSHFGPVHYDSEGPLDSLWGCWSL